MIDVFSYSSRGVSQKKIEQHRVTSSLTWVRCIKPTKVEVEKLSKKTKIPRSSITKATTHTLRPSITINKEYSKLVFTMPEKTKTGYTTVPITIFLWKNDVITVSANSVLLTKRLTKKPFDFEFKSSSFLHALMQEVLTSYFGIFEILEDDIEHLEKRAFEKASDGVAKKIFTTKKTLIYFRKALVANRDVLHQIHKGYLKEIDKKNISHFHDLSQELSHLIELESTYFDILTGTLDLYLGTINRNSNNVVKTLTVIASFVLVPTLISGIYGMNFQFMPEIHAAWGQRFGYLFSLALMALSVIILFVYFKHKEYL